MIPVSAAEKILDGKTFFVSTFLDKYKVNSIWSYTIFKFWIFQYSQICSILFR